MKVDFETIVNS